MTVTIISYGISYAIKLASSVLASLISYILFLIYPNTSSLYIILFVIHAILAILLFRIKRFKNGLPFLYMSNVRFIGILISAIISLFYTIASDERYSFSIILQAFITLAIFSLLLFFWWKENLIAVYIERQKSKELEYAYAIIKEKSEYIQKLEVDNDTMSKIIHRDNKLIPSIQSAIHSFIAEEMLNSTPNEAKGISILKQLNELTEERAGMIHNHRPNTKSLPKTGLFLIDIMAEYMLSKAENSGVVFDMKVFGDPCLLTEKYLTEKDLCTIFADLTENSLISVSYAEEKEIIVQIGMDEFDSISISDSGIPFEPHILYELGRKRATTHAKHGGSGIGMMTLFEIIKKSKASLVINEYEPGTNRYTKTLSVEFDGKNEYRINSFRSDLLSANCRRSDIIFNQLTLS